MTLPSDLRHLKPDAFHEGMDWTHAVGILAALFVIAWAMGKIDERAEVKVNAAAPATGATMNRQVTDSAASNESAPAAAAPLLAHPMPDCQWIAQSSMYGKPRPRCVDADLSKRKMK